jgi:hypothetical protein
MADFPVALTGATDNVTDVLAKHINNIETKIGINSSADASSIDYKLGVLVANTSGVNSGDNAANSSSTYIGTTAHALNRTTAAETIAGLTLTSPILNTPTIAANSPNNSAVFSMDVSGQTAFNLADNAEGYPMSNANNFAGFFILQNTTQGNIAMCLVGGGVLAIIAQTAGGLQFTTTKDSASKTNLYMTSSVVTIQNKNGAAANFKMMAFRTAVGT